MSTIGRSPERGYSRTDFERRCDFHTKLVSRTYLKGPTARELVKKVARGKWPKQSMMFGGRDPKGSRRRFQGGKVLKQFESEKGKKIHHKEKGGEKKKGEMRAG